jgi:hypothetical protein
MDKVGFMSAGESWMPAMMPDQLCRRAPAPSGADFG